MRGDLVDIMQQRPLTWADVELWFPECSAQWDCERIEWTPILRLQEDLGFGNPPRLWADDADCVDRTRKMGHDACRCRYWDADIAAWIPRVEVFQFQEWRRKSREWDRQYLGRWVPDGD